MITSAKEIRNNIFGKNAVETKTIKTPYEAYNYAYKTKGERYYLYISETGERRRISEENYNKY